MKYIECTEVFNTHYCMSHWCHCSSTEIKRGDGYIYISPKVVAFRRNACSQRAFQNKLLKRAKPNKKLMQNEYEPILICKKAAQLYNLDLDISSNDAKIWWEMHKVPLRKTPTVLEIRKFPPQETGRYVEEMADNIIDEKKIRSYGRDFLIQTNTTPRYIIRNKDMNMKSMFPEFSYLSKNPEKGLSSLKYLLSLIKWLFPIIFTIWFCVSVGMFF